MNFIPTSAPETGEDFLFQVTFVSGEGSTYQQEAGVYFVTHPMGLPNVAEWENF